VLGARRGSLLEEVAAACESDKSIALPVETDVSDRDDVERLLNSAISAFGRIDVWVNNAGVAAVGRFEDSPLDDHVQVVSTDLLGTMYGSFFALQQFRKQSYGTLINVASILGKFPVPYYASYTAAKYGVVGLSGALRQELRQNHERHIHVCTVLPEAMETPFFEHASNYTGHEVTPPSPVGDPQLVVDAIIGLMTQPQDEIIVGFGGELANLAHKFVPSLVENAIGSQTHKSQIENAEITEMTRGAVLRPMVEENDSAPK
jgi:short-subunit dehydrogenase